MVAAQNRMPARTMNEQMSAGLFNNLLAALARHLLQGAKIDRS